MMGKPRGPIHINMSVAGLLGRLFFKTGGLENSMFTIAIICSFLVGEGARKWSEDIVLPPSIAQANVLVTEKAIAQRTKYKSMVEAARSKTETFPPEGDSSACESTVMPGTVSCPFLRFSLHISE
ncbi:putative isoaspartyl peptidase/L-asparaginase 4 [Sesbania bispinosa]|nr:putative isoaspartyl peptidase/L-asparaginase 4 [Sesbania bispinosa]